MGSGSAHSTMMLSCLDGMRRAPGVGWEEHRVKAVASCLSPLESSTPFLTAPPEDQGSCCGCRNLIFPSCSVLLTPPKQVGPPDSASGRQVTALSDKGENFFQEEAGPR